MEVARNPRKHLKFSSTPRLDFLGPAFDFRIEHTEKIAMCFLLRHQIANLTVRGIAFRFICFTHITQDDRRPLMKMGSLYFTNIICTYRYNNLGTIFSWISNLLQVNYYHPSLNTIVKFLPKFVHRSKIPKKYIIYVRKSAEGPERSFTDIYTTLHTFRTLVWRKRLYVFQQKHHPLVA